MSALTRPGKLRSELEAAAKNLADPAKGHQESHDGFRTCQWPEQGLEHADKHRYDQLGMGCRGCLIGAVADGLHRGNWYYYNHPQEFKGEDARLIYMRAIELCGENQQQEKTERMSAEVVAC